MPLPATAKASAAPPSALLDRLGGVAASRGLPSLADRLRLLGELVAGDLAACEIDLAAMPRGDGASASQRGRTLVERSASHLLDLGGKRLRPVCVALAARLGSGFHGKARELAVAVELVHNATLLHDDVIDLGELRRGAPTARAVYGNAASIFAGDWLLVEALRRVRRAGVDGTLDRLLAVIEEMIFAESAQLEGRGRLQVDRTLYFRIVEGKTASLFRWALFAGGSAGGLDDTQCRALEGYGDHLGVAFQAVDDLLDLTGDAAATGKALFADLREGKLTFPLIVALEREPELRPVLECAVGDAAVPLPPELIAVLLAALARTGAVDECRALARSHAAQAVACLDAVPECAARAALVTVAEATVGRDR
jgi:octaprenyl-diphosphate synthase